MGTAVIVAILIIIILISVQSSMKHMKGEGGCCGGEADSLKVKRQKLKQVVETKRICIEGMKCDNCRKNVENGLNSLNQVNARVNRKKKEALVQLGEKIPEETLKSTIENMGYRVISIEEVKMQGNR